MKHDTSLHARSLDELLDHWPAVVRAAESGWSKSFATSIAKQARRRGWKPTAKQGALMSRMVQELFALESDGDDFRLIEDRPKGPQRVSSDRSPAAVTLKDGRHGLPPSRTKGGHDPGTSPTPRRLGPYWTCTEARH